MKAARGSNTGWAALVVFLLVPLGEARPAASCARTIADVAAFDEPLMFNGLGVQAIAGMMFAVRRDVIERSC